MKKKNIQRLNPDKRKAMLLESLLAVIQEKGFNRVTVPDVVSKAQVAQGTFYHYFSNLEEAKIELINQVLKPLQKAINELDFEQVRSREQLEKFLYNFYYKLGTIIFQQKQIMSSLLIAAAGEHGTIRQKVVDYLNYLYLYLHDFVKKNSGRPPFREMDDSVLPSALLGMIIGGIFEAEKSGEHFDVQRWATEMARFETGALTC